MENIVKFEFYVPEDHADKVKMAVFDAGGGKIGNYDCCCWQTRGEGQFRPLENSSPYLGKQDEIETVTEMKIEMVCEANLIDDVIKAMKESHPYETPAYSYWPFKQ